MWQLCFVVTQFPGLTDTVKDHLDVTAKEKVAEQLLGVKAVLKEDFDGGWSYDIMCKVRALQQVNKSCITQKVNFPLVFSN